MEDSSCAGKCFYWLRKSLFGTTTHLHRSYLEGLTQRE